MADIAGSRQERITTHYHASANEVAPFNSSKVQIRLAEAKDAATIHELTRQLAIYQKSESQMLADPQDFQEHMEELPPSFECLLAFVDDIAVGMAMFHYTYSSWAGRRGLYLCDLFVAENYRQFGIGRMLFVELANIARQRNCCRIEWSVLAWNTQAISFYEGLGASPHSGWLNMRLDSNGIDRIASSSSPSIQASNLRSTTGTNDSDTAVQASTRSQQSEQMPVPGIADQSLPGWIRVA